MIFLFNINEDVFFLPRGRIYRSISFPKSLISANLKLTSLSLSQG